jgi:hypothetical protein
MRTLSVVLLLTACSAAQKAATGEECLVVAGGDSLFGKAPEGAPAIAAAVRDGAIVAAAGDSARDFDAKMVEIAADPAASAQWSEVAPDPSKARAAGLAADLPTNASALRSAGVPEAEVRTAVEGASKARMSAADISDAFAAVGKHIETYGPFDGFGAWFVQVVQTGDRGPALMDDIEVEYQTRGGKVGNDKVQICHRPPGNPDNRKTLSIGASAVQAHLAHGDTEGPCEGDAGEGDGHGKPGAKGGGPGKGGGAANGHKGGNGKGKPAGRGH